MYHVAMVQKKTPHFIFRRMLDVLDEFRRESIKAINGFDLMHGVSSSYYNFRDFLGKESELRKQLEEWNLEEDLWADGASGVGDIPAQAYA